MALMLTDIHSGAQQLLIDWSMEPLGYLSVNNNQIFFTRSSMGQDQGFCYRDGKVYMIQCRCCSWQLPIGCRPMESLPGAVLPVRVTVCRFQIQIVYSGTIR